MAEPGTHTDLALACIAARYRHLGHVVQPSARRSPLPPRQPGTSLLKTAFDDLFDDVDRLAGRTLLASAGCGQSPIKGAESAVRKNLGPMLTSPDRVIDAIVVTTGPDAYRRADGIGVVPAAMLGP